MSTNNTKTTKQSEQSHTCFFSIKEIHDELNNKFNYYQSKITYSFSKTTYSFNRYPSKITYFFNKFKWRESRIDNLDYFIFFYLKSFTINNFSLIQF
jgi:hypothetical protein